MCMEWDDCQYYLSQEMLQMNLFDNAYYLKMHIYRRYKSQSSKIRITKQSIITPW